MANKVFPPQLHFVHFHQILNSLMHFKISSLTATWHHHHLEISYVIWLVLCVLPFTYHIVSCLRAFPSPSISSPLLLFILRNHTHQPILSESFSNSYRVNYVLISIFFRTLYMPIIFHVLSCNCHMFFTKFFEVSNRVRFILNTLTIPIILDNVKIILLNSLELGFTYNPPCFW